VVKEGEIVARADPKKTFGLRPAPLWKIQRKSSSKTTASTAGSQQAASCLVSSTQATVGNMDLSRSFLREKEAKEISIVCLI
jgi:hypothetical protein